MTVSIAEATREERIAMLEQQVAELASFVGRLTAATFGDRFDEVDDIDDTERLTWTEVVSDPGTEDEGTVGWWTYNQSMEALDA